MNAIIAFILITVSPDGTVGMQEFADEQACKAVQSELTFELARGKGVRTACMPKATTKQ